MRALLLLLVLLPMPVAAQDTGEVLIVHDMDGAVGYAGSYATFGVLVVDGQGRPLPHQDVSVGLVQDGRTLYALDAARGHDYDGVQEFQVRFDRPGAFELRAISGGKEAVLTGMIEERELPTSEVELTAPDQVVAGDPFEIRVRPLADGALAPHTDAIVQVLDAEGREVLRVHTHTHTEDQVLRASVPDAGTYTVRAVASTYFASGAPELAQVLAERQVTATPATGPALPLPVAAPGMNPVHEATAGDLELYGTVDPFDVVRVGMPVDLAVTVMDQGAPAAHVDFEAVLEGPGGVLFDSASLHEYDGVLHVRTLASTPGDHVLRVHASRGDDEGTIDVPFTVQGGLLDAAPEPALALAEPAACDGPLRFQATRADGSAYGHAEVRFEVFQDDLPVRAGKAHTHGDGLFVLEFGLREDAVFAYRLDPTRADPEGAARTVGQIELPGPCGPTDPVADVAHGASVPPYTTVAVVLAVIAIGLGIAFWKRP